MLEMICHHTYDTWQGLPVDRSPYRLSGGDPVGAVYLADGVAPGSGALDFGSDPDNGVRIPTSAAWQDLGAVEVRMTVYLTGGPDLLGDRRVLVEADDSFTFSASQFFLGGPTGFVHHLGVRIVDPNADDGYLELGSGAAPFNRWATVGFRYDGVQTVQLLVDDAVVAEGRMTSPLRPVGSGGIAIGAPVNGTVTNHPLVVDEVQVWRRDPSYIRRVFLSRPLTPGAGDCLARALGAINDAWSADPQLAAEQRRAAAQLQEFLTRNIIVSGAADEWQQLHERYVELWTSGAIDSDEMEEFLREAVAWWRDKGGDPMNDADLRGIIGGLTPPPGGIDLDCDPVLAGFLTRLNAVAGS